MAKEGILSDPAIQGRLRESQKSRDVLVNEAVKDLLKSKNGRLLFGYIINDLLGLQSICLSNDVREAAIWEGRRLAAKTIDELLERADPISHGEMCIERIYSRRTDEAARLVAVKPNEDDDA